MTTILSAPYVPPRQLALPFIHRPSFAVADFLADATNEQARIWINRTPDWPDGRLALWGEAGCGKSHLLHNWAEREGAAVLSGPELSGLPAVPGAMGIDDADLIADEPALLHLLNMARELRRPVLLVGRVPPTEWRIALPDLASRVRAVVAVRVETPRDSLLDALLTRLLSDRQLCLPTAVRDWMRVYLPRTPGALRDAVARLDHAALVEREPIRLSRARAVLSGGDWAADGDDDNPESPPYPSFPADRLL